MINKKLLLVLLLGFLVSINPGAKENNGVVSNKFVAGNVRLINSSSMGSEFSAIDKAIGSFQHKWSINGVSVAIAKDGKLVFARGFGYADSSLKTETQPFNKFRIASVSKLVTAVAIMKLREEGKLSLQDHVFGPDGILNDSYFDNPKDKRVYSITVEHLLSHEGGWTQRYGDQMFMPIVIAEKMGVPTPVDTKTIVRFALDKRLHYTPGMGHSYSNLGYSILGLVVEKVSGVSYEEYCHKAIFEPLGIYDMAIGGNLESDRAPFEVTYYEPKDAGMKPSIYNHDEMCLACYGGNDITTLGSAGGWIATAPDLMKLLLAVDGFNTRPDILNPESIGLMTTNENGAAPLGWKSILKNGTWWRTGYFPGTTAMLKRQPDGYSWVVLCNTSSWNGPEIYSYINNMMTKIFNQPIAWPDYDLFSLSLPVPLKTAPLAGYPG
ncbi:MAG TPA: serine hydrolase domain-containing protein [Bacteroidales bacterium]|nr:serine hydrolase domain-containing protein [Bacteroidales bacterium]